MFEIGDVLENGENWGNSAKGKWEFHLKPYNEFCFPKVAISDIPHEPNVEILKKCFNCGKKWGEIIFSHFDFG